MSIRGIGPDGTASTTATSKLPPALFSDASVAVQATVVVPSGNKLPDAGSQLTDGAGSTASVDVATKAWTAPSVPVASSEADGGSSSVGGVVSTNGVTVGVGGMAVGSGVAVGIGGPTVGFGVAFGFGGLTFGFEVAVGLGVEVGSGAGSTTGGVAVDVGASAGIAVDVGERTGVSSTLFVSGDAGLIGVGVNSTVAIGVGVGSITTAAFGVTMPARPLAVVGVGWGVGVGATGADRWMAARFSGLGIGEGVSDCVSEGNAVAVVIA